MSIYRRRTIQFFVVAGLLLITAHRLPAPIQEIPENPTPAPEQSAKPKAKRIAKTKSNANESATKLPAQPTGSKRSQFAGMWVGTMQTIPYGNLPSVVTIDSTETAMAMSWYEADDAGDAKIHQHFKSAPESARGHSAANPAYARARREGDTLIASFPAPLLGKSTWSLTPQSDGVTANVRMQAFMNDFTAVFHRSSESGGAR